MLLLRLNCNGYLCIKSKEEIIQSWVFLDAGL